MSPIASSQVLQDLEDYDLFYKNFFSHPEVIISLLHDLLPEELDTLLDLSTVTYSPTLRGGGCLLVQNAQRR